MVKTIIFLVHGHKLETEMLIGEVEKKMANPNPDDGGIAVDGINQEHEKTKVTHGAYARFNPKNVVALVAIA